MELILLVANWILPLAYLALLIDYGATFTLRVRTTGRSPWLAAVIVVHAAFLALRGAVGGWPQVTGPYAVPSLLALSMALLYAILERATRDRRTGVFVLALVFLLQYTSSIFFSRAGEGPASEPAMGASTWTGLHVLPAILAYTALAFAAVYGLLYVMVSRRLKQHRFGVLFDRLPPLEKLGTMTWHALLTGFVFMTLAIASAPLMMHAQEGARAGGAMDAKIWMKIVTGAVAWAVYATAVLGRLAGRWAMARIAATAALGFVIVLVLLAASVVLS